MSEAQEPSVTVVMPWRDQGDKDRQASKEWLVGWYHRRFPDWHVMLADSPGMWSKPTAINNAVAMAPSDVVVVTDTDVFPDHRTVLRTAVRHALTAPWVVPHGLVHRLRAEPTAAILGTYAAAQPAYGPLVRSPYLGVPGGGLFVVRRSRFLATGGFDQRFRGWGGEDTSWGVAADCLLGKHLRYPHVNLMHLWHAPGLREVDPHYGENVLRVGKYRKAAELGRGAMAHLCEVDVPAQETPSVPMPKRDDPCEEWLLYLSAIGVKVPRTIASQKLALIALAVQNQPGVTRW